jgi:hypothetical protein
MIYDEDFAAHYIHYYLNDEYKEKFCIEDLLFIIKLQAKFFNNLEEPMFGEFYNKPLQVKGEDITAFILENIDRFYISATEEEIEIILDFEFNFMDEMGLIDYGGKDDDSDDDDGPDNDDTGGGDDDSINTNPFLKYVELAPLYNKSLSVSIQNQFRDLVL